MRSILNRLSNRLVFASLIGLLCYMMPANADLNYNTYQGTGAYPTFPGNGGTLYYSTPLSSGTVATINHNWGSGVVLDSGLTERVIVNYYGYITIPTAGTYTFYNASDDGFHMKIDGAVVIDDWQEQGTQYYNGVGTKTFASAGTYAIDVWYYENGGGAASMLFWNLNGSIQIVSEEYYTTEMVLASGPSAEQLDLRTTNRAITNSGNGIYIQQSGTGVDINIVQSGNDNLIAGSSTTSQTISDAVVSGDYNTLNIEQRSNNNVLLFGINGNHNTLNSSQGNNVNDTGGHRATVNITGNDNTLTLEQYNTGFGSGQFANMNITGNDNTINSAQRETDKMLFVDVNGNNNSIVTNQKDSGQHFLDITVGSNQTLSVTQEGTGDHSATINMSGYSSTLQLNQNSTTDQNYHLFQNCANLNGCGTTTVNQQ